MGTLTRMKCISVYVSCLFDFLRHHLHEDTVDHCHRIATMITDMVTSLCTSVLFGSSTQPVVQSILCLFLLPLDVAVCRRSLKPAEVTVSVLLYVLVFRCARLYEAVSVGVFFCSVMTGRRFSGPCSMCVCDQCACRCSLFVDT